MTKMQRRESLKQTARSFFKAILRGVVPVADSRKDRPIHFEPLESRQLMAADFYDAASLAAASSLPSTAAPAQITSMSTSSLVGEGEDAQNLVEFAKALKQAGVKFFGADWCPFCSEQKALFQDGAQFLRKHNDLSNLGIQQRPTCYGRSDAATAFNTFWRGDPNW
jgi:thiol-disulfide isomerase/thioredoxin